MRFDIKRLILDTVLIVLIPLVFMTVLGVYGAVRPTKLVSSTVPEHYGLEYENVSLLTDDGIKLAAWYIPRRGEPTDAAIVVLHGYPTDKGDLLARSKFLVDYFNVLYVDFRYFGQSGGSYTTMGAREVLDMKAAVEYLKLEKRMRKVGVYGFAMGGAVALMGASGLQDEVNAVVSEAAYANLAMMIRDMYRYLGPVSRPLYWSTRLVVSVFLKIDLDDVSPAVAARGLHIPVLVVHSQNDRVISFDNALMIQDSLLEDKQAEYLFMSEGNHGDVSVEFAQKMLEFFLNNLK